MLYVQDSSLERDAKRTELEFASARIILARVRAAFIGGALPIARIVTSLLCVAALLVPFADVAINTPAFGKDISLSGLGIYNLFSDGFFMKLFDFAKSILFGGVIKSMFIPMGVLFAIALIDVVILLAEILCFTNIKKSTKVMYVASAVGVAFCVVFFIVAMITKKSADGLNYITFKVGFGALVTALMFIANFVVNYLICKKDIPLKLRPYDIERRELLHKIKKGELDFDDLPLPVFETEEEREARLKELEEMLAAEEAD